MGWELITLIVLASLMIMVIGGLVLSTLLSTKSETSRDLEKYQTAYALLQEKAVKLERRVKQLEKELAAEKKKIKVRRIHA